MNDPTNEQAKQADIDDKWWHFVLFFPVIINSFILISFCFFIKEDSIMFNLSEGNEQGALRLIEKIYVTSKADATEVIDGQKNVSS